MIGGHLPNAALTRMVLMGINGYVEYEKLDEDLLSAAQVLWSGRLWMPSEILEDAVRIRVADSAELHTRRPGALTLREGQLLRLLRGNRFSNKELGVVLRITERTVKFHLDNIYKKTGVHDRFALVDLAAGKVLTAVNAER